MNDKSGGSNDMDMRNSTGAMLHDALEFTLLVYVNKKYRGNVTKLRLSGFPLKADPQKHGLAPALEIVNNCAAYALLL